MTTTSTTLNPINSDYAWTLGSVAHEAKLLANWIRRIDRWHAYCALPAAERDTVKAPGMPSKNSKHQAYGRASHIIRMMEARGGVELPARPENLDGLRLVVAAASTLR